MMENALKCELHRNQQVLAIILTRVTEKTLAVLCYRAGEDKIIFLRFCSFIAGTIHVTPFTVSFCCIIMYWGWNYSINREIRIVGL